VTDKTIVILSNNFAILTIKGAFVDTLKSCHQFVFRDMFVDSLRTSLPTSSFVSPRFISQFCFIAGSKACSSRSILAYTLAVKTRKKRARKNTLATILFFNLNIILVIL